MLDGRAPSVARGTHNSVPTEPSNLCTRSLGLAAPAKPLSGHLPFQPPGSLQRSLAALRAATDDPGTAEVVTLLATKPMQLAQYFCTAGRDKASWVHYALAMDMYTHFTSPIRSAYNEKAVLGLRGAGVSGFGVRQGVMGAWACTVHALHVTHQVGHWGAASRG